MATAKTKTKKTTKAKTAKKVETKTPSFVRKGALAYLGLYGFAAERAQKRADQVKAIYAKTCLLYTSPSPRDKRQSRMPSSA